MKWQGHWWGTVILAENENDNRAIDALLKNMEEKPDSTYEDGDLEVETKEGLRVISFHR